MASISDRLPTTVSLRLLIGVILAGTLSVLDSTIVVPLLGTIGSEFGGGTEVSWLVAAYLLASTVTIPLWGRWMDVCGERTPMWIALAVFLVGTVMCAVAPSLMYLIVGRVVQGIGAGGIVPLGQAILAARCSREDRARLQIFYNVAYGVAAGLGPIVGGALIHVSWRWAFWIILPFVVVVMLAFLGQLRTTPTSRLQRPFDKLGSVLIATGLTALLLAVERSWWWLLVIGVVVIAVFIRHSLRTTYALVPAGLLRSKIVMSCSLIGLLIGFVQFAFLTYLPLFSQHIAPQLNSGLVVVPLTVLWMTLGAITGILALRMGSKLMLLIAIVCAIAASLILVVWFAEPALFIASALVGAAAGFALIPALLLAQQASPLDDIGAATSTFVLLRNFGGALGAAVTAVVLAATSVTTSMVMLAFVAAVAVLPLVFVPGKHGDRNLRRSTAASS